MPRCGTVRRRGGQPVCQRILKFDPSGTYEGHFSRVGDTVLTVSVSGMPGAPAPTAWWCPRSTATCCGVTSAGHDPPALACPTGTGGPRIGAPMLSAPTTATRPACPLRALQPGIPAICRFVGSGTRQPGPGSSSVKEKPLEMRVSRRADDRILPSAQSRSAAAREIPRPSATSLSGRTGMAATSSTRMVTGRPGQPGIGSASRTHAPSQSTVSRFR